MKRGAASEMRVAVPVLSGTVVDVLTDKDLVT